MYPGALSNHIEEKMKKKMYRHFSGQIEQRPRVFGIHSSGWTWNVNITERKKRIRGGVALKCVPETVTCHLNGGLWFLEGVPLLWSQRMNANKLSWIGIRIGKRTQISCPVASHFAGFINSLLFPCTSSYYSAVKSSKSVNSWRD